MKSGSACFFGAGIHGHVSNGFFTIELLFRRNNPKLHRLSKNESDVFFKFLIASLPRHPLAVRPSRSDWNARIMGKCICGAESKDQAREVLERFAGNETLGLGLDAKFSNVLFSEGIRGGLVPEVGLEPT